MAINPLQLPGPMPVPQVDFTPLSRIGMQIGQSRQAEQERAREAAAFGGLVDAATAGQPGQPQQAPAGGVPFVTAGGQPSPQLPRGLRNNNPGNIEDGPLAKSLPGYAGSDGRFAKFDTPDNGLNAMDALLTSYGRRGLKTVRDVISRWAPSSDGNPVDAYARYVGNGNPDAPVDLSNPEQRKALALRMAQFENGMAHPMPAAPQQAAQARQGMPPDLAKKVQALFAVGTPGATAAAMGIVNRYLGKQEPIKLNEGDVLLDPNTYQPLARGPEKQQRGFEPKVVTVKDKETGVERSMIFDPKSGKLTEINEAPRSGTQPAEPLPPGVDPAVVRRERSEALVKNEQASVESARSAAQLQPLIDEAVRSYEKAASLGAIGPFVGNEYVRGANKMLIGTEGERARQSYDRALAAIQAWRTGLQNKGQGALSDFERKMYALQYPNVQDLDPADQVKFLKQIQAETAQTVKAGRSSTLGRQPSVVTERPPVQSGASIRVNSPAEAAKLPSGTRFIDPNGVERIRP